MSFLNIAIDGPSGAGKSTLAKKLAAALGFLYVDTGAIYRTVGLFAARNGVDCADADRVVPLLATIVIRIAYGQDDLQHMYLFGEDVTDDIRRNEVSVYASQVSAIPQVRIFLLEMQRSLAQKNNVVMDGRDIGTVVLPHADLKIFLTASPERRAERRRLELLEKGENLPFETVLAEILARDEADANRPVAPLREAEDAVRVDTSQINLEESLSVLRRVVKEKLNL